jgi:chorismate dehydratase
MTALHVGRIAALNMYPVYHHLEHVADGGLRFTDGVPSELNDALLEGRLDVSAMSSIAFARHAERLTLMPVASIAADGAVDSIQLFSRVPFEQVRTVAVTPHSATSVALLRVLRGAPAPSFDLLAEAPEAALRRYDGVLLIGDEALTGLRAGIAPHATDLSRVWRERTGLPMVFAVWAARAEVAERDPAALDRLAGLLTEARRRYEEHPEEVARAAAERFPFPLDFIRGYLQRLRYGFGEPERAGLERFLEMARGASLIDAVPRLAA